DRPGELGPGEVRHALDRLLRSNNAAVSNGAAEVSKGLASVWEMEERTRSSIYATAQTVVWPWSDPGVAASARSPKHTPRRNGRHPRGRTQVGEHVDLSWLLSDANTVYLCSPIEDQRRLAP